MLTHISMFFKPAATSQALAFFSIRLHSSALFSKLSCKMYKAINVVRMSFIQIDGLILWAVIIWISLREPANLEHVPSAMKNSSIFSHSSEAIHWPLGCWNAMNSLKFALVGTLTLTISVTVLVTSFSVSNNYLSIYKNSGTISWKFYNLSMNENLLSTNSLDSIMPAISHSPRN